MNQITSGIDLARRKGIGAALKAAAWRFKTAAFKRRISLEDRLGWYSYADWIRDFEQTSARSSEKRGSDQAAGGGPRFSLILPAGAATSPNLNFSLASLEAQSFTSWEALIVLEQDTPELRPETQDPRIRIELYPSQGRYADARLAALEKAAGDFVLALEPGDAIHPGALAAVADAADRSPGLEAIYTDEDQLTEGGVRRAPFFKPDWSPELMLSVNYLAHAFFRRQFLEEVSAASEGDRPAWEDLVWICAERLRRIQHVPRVLYHNRATPELPPQAQNRGGQVKAHLRRRGFFEPAVEVDTGGATRLRWPVRGDKVSIIIPTKDRVDYLKRCVESIREKTAYPDYEIILVDSGSTEAETLRFYQEAPYLRVVRFVGPFNFSGALNLGAQEAGGPVLLFLNNDTQAIDGDWLAELVRWAERPEIGIVGGQLQFSDGSIQHAGIILGLEGHASHVFGGARPGAGGPYGPVDWYRNFSAVTGACMAMRKDVFHKIGGFDEGYQLVFSDIEICLKAIRAGYRVMYTPFARLLHHEGKTRQRYIPAQDIARAYDHLKELVARGDPYFNPNLSTAVRVPTFRRPAEEPAIERLREIVNQSV